MKKFILKSSLFILFFILFLGLINFIYMSVITRTDFDFRKRLESIRFDNPDFKLLAMGASLALDGFDTDMLTSKGIKSYNLALGGGTERTSYIQLDEYLTAYNNKPKYVFLGLNSVLQSLDDERLHPIVEVTMKDHKYSLNDMPILRFKWLGFEFLKKLVSRKHRQAELVYGQLKFQKIMPDHSDYIESYFELSRYESSHWIGEIARLCTQNDIKLILIEMPGFRETQNLSPVGPYEANFANGFSATLYNLNAVDFCQIFEANGDWIGTSHLNEFGAEKFTEAMMEVLLIP